MDAFIWFGIDLEVHTDTQRHRHINTYTSNCMDGAWTGFDIFDTIVIGFPIIIVTFYICFTACSPINLSVTICKEMF